VTSSWFLFHTNVFYCRRAFCWYIKDIITVRKMHGMESFKNAMPSFVKISHVIWSLLDGKAVAQRGINKRTNYFQL